MPRLSPFSFGARKITPYTSDTYAPAGWSSRAAYGGQEVPDRSRERLPPVLRNTMRGAPLSRLAATPVAAPAASPTPQVTAPVAPALDRQRLEGARYFQGQGYALPINPQTGAPVLPTDPEYRGFLDAQNRLRPGVPEWKPAAGADRSTPFSQQAFSDQELTPYTGLLFKNWQENFAKARTGRAGFNSLDEYDQWFQSIRGFDPQFGSKAKAIYESTMPKNVKAEYTAKQASQLKVQEIAEHDKIVESNPPSVGFRRIRNAEGMLEDVIDPAFEQQRQLAQAASQATATKRENLAFNTKASEDWKKKNPQYEAPTNPTTGEIFSAQKLRPHGLSESAVARYVERRMDLQSVVDDPENSELAHIVAQKERVDMITPKSAKTLIASLDKALGEKSTKAAETTPAPASKPNVPDLSTVAPDKLQAELKRLYDEEKKRNPNFTGKIPVIINGRQAEYAP